MTGTVAVAGAGLSGAVLARELAERGGRRVVVFEESDHVAGHCHTERDPATGVMVHAHGPHIFHTDNEQVWRYVNRFDDFQPFCLRVVAVTARGVFSLPVNLLTINQFFGAAMDPGEARAFVDGLSEGGERDPRTFEEQALRFVGRDLYEAFFRGYTRKQWGVDPSRLPASVLRRLPVRFTYDDNYFDHRFQGIPRSGYTAVVERILDHPDIEVRLAVRFESTGASEFDHVFFTGPLDAWFGHRLGRLRYRTLRFERVEEAGDHQGAAIVNYCEESVPYTRVTEHKHLAPWERHDATVAFREYSSDAGPADTPYYPLRLVDDERLLREYVDLAEGERGVTFLGRLATYRYLDMHVVVEEALDLAHRFLDRPPATPFPAFGQPPLPRTVNGEVVEHPLR